ncbi:MAG TPA: carboxypeptidase-like regulatory domain-containing protein [Pyrinomonadaceae bacterium]|nr:carboxypeptidase-like regulatory domain-containing protein [Pyrinomonadaceae bacterium]
MSGRRFFAALVLTALVACAAFGQGKTTGSIKGKVSVDNSSTPGNVTVIVRQGDAEVARTETNRSGEFVIGGLAPGLYGMTFRKAGLSVGTLEKVEVRAGKTRSLGGKKLFLPVDTGSLAFIRGSVFDADGRSVPGARVELSLVRADGSRKSLDGRVTTESGMFQFRLTPEPARYLITVKAQGMETTTKEVAVEGAGRTNIAITVRKGTE